ncbi:MAG TPA: sodium:solute symporter family protein [Candidatus Deferrimicrobium sp.]|nr:sodium:solute symporter family protein [Candidatus Deferrimicrobium sp.]
MNQLDLVIVAAYLIGLFIWAIYIGLKETAEDFLVLSRRAPLVLVAFSIISTWVGTGTTIATAASGYDLGISLGVTAACGGLVGVVIAAWFAPRLKWFGDTYRAHTIGDFFSARYSRTARLPASALLVIIYMLLTAAQFVGLTTLLHVWTGIDFGIIIWFAAVSTIIYTAFAGIKSDFYTDVIHFVVMVIVIVLILLPFVVKEIGGVHVVSALPASYFNPFAFGGVSFFVAGLIFGGASVFVTMEVWQRVYASSSGRNARLALLVSVLVIIGFYLVSSFLGMAAKLVNPSLPHRDQALFMLMNKLLPTGLLGLGIAGFVAVFVSTVNSTIMVAAATVTKDFYRGLANRNANDKQLLTAGRVSTLICGAVGLVIAVLLPDLVALSVNSLFMLLVLVPAIVGGFFWERGTARGAASSVVIGTGVIVAFLAVSPTTAFVPGFAASLLTYILVSLMTAHGKEEDLAIVGGWSRTVPDHKRNA